MLDFFLDNFYVCNELLNTPISELEFSILDFETTGLYPYNGDRIIEIGITRINHTKDLAQFESLINPLVPIPEAVTKINYITQEMVKEAPLIEDKIDSLMDFIKNSVIVAHNLSFDLSFLNFQLQKMQRNKVDLWMVDTIKVAKALFPELERYSLSHITKALKIRNEESHRALSDTKATAKIFRKFIQNLPPNSSLKALHPFKIH